MRVTIAGRAFSDRHAIHTHPAGDWWVRDAGLTGWYETPVPRVESDPIADGDGNYTPSRFLWSARTVVARLIHVAGSSSLARAAAEDWVSGLPGEFPFLVEDEHGLREATVFRAPVAPEYAQLNRTAIEFSLTVTAPDPVKYGPPARFTGGWAENAGLTPVLPWRIVTTGRATRIVVDLAGFRIRWIGNATNVVIDTRAGVATAQYGDVTPGLVEDNIPLLEPGRTPLRIDTDAASCVVEVRPGWL